MAMNKIQYILVKLSEECAELSKEASKATIFGIDNVYEDEKQIDKLMQEYIDVSAVMHMLLSELDVSMQELDVEEAILKKIDKVNRYMNISRKLGLLESE